MEQNKQRIVVKVGTSTLTHDSGAVDLRSMEHLVRVLSDLSGAGHEVILVTSGAIAVGTARLGLSERPKELRMKQAAAAVGQCRMMHIYDKLFSEYNRTMAQILLTGDDVEDPERAEHLRSTFSALLEMGVIPVVNENDSVSSGFSDSRIRIHICDSEGAVFYNQLRFVRRQPIDVHRVTGSRSFRRDRSDERDIFCLIHLYLCFWDKRLVIPVNSEQNLICRRLPISISDGRLYQILRPVVEISGYIIRADRNRIFSHLQDLCYHFSHVPV